MDRPARGRAGPSHCDFSTVKLQGAKPGVDDRLETEHPTVRLCETNIAHGETSPRKIGHRHERDVVLHVEWDRWSCGFGTSPEPGGSSMGAQHIPATRPLTTFARK